MLAKYSEAQRRWAEKNHERMKLHRVAVYRAKMDGPERFDYQLKRCNRTSVANGFIGCTATAAELQARFAGECDICGRLEAETGKKLCIDHDHQTGEFRGWLCWSCNSGLGKLGDNLDRIIERVINYRSRVRGEI